MGQGAQGWRPRLVAAGSVGGAGSGERGLLVGSVHTADYGTLQSRCGSFMVSTPLENEAIAPLENEATQTDWVGDLSGGLGADPAAGCGRGSAAAGGTAAGYRQVNGRPGGGLGGAAEV